MRRTRLQTLSTWLTLPVSRPNVKVVRVRMVQATKDDDRRGRREGMEGRGREGRVYWEVRGSTIQRREVAQQANTHALV